VVVQIFAELKKEKREKRALGDGGGETKLILNARRLSDIPRPRLIERLRKFLGILEVFSVSTIERVN
jgi:hypothetical protein